MIEKWSAGYSLLKLYVNFAMWLGHKRIVVTGLENIPESQAFIFAPNHQNALLDPLAIICTSETQTVWLARADIFNVKFIRPILTFFKILPVYRIRDGKENLSRNDHIFDEAVRILENKKVVGLFPEAAHSGKRQMISHKKAVPRIAFIAEERNNFNLNLLIIPVGIYYSHYWKLNRTVIVNYGEPIWVKRYQKSYNESPQKAMTELRDKIYEKLEQLTLNIKSELYEDYEFILEAYAEQYALKRVIETNKTLNLFYAKKDLVEKLESLNKDSQTTFQKLYEALSNYRDILTKTGLTNKGIQQAEKNSIVSLSLKAVVAIITLPIFIFSFVLNFIPYIIPRNVIQKKVKDHAFRSTFNFVIGITLFPVYYLILFLISWKLSGQACITFFAIICLPFIGKLSLSLFDFYQSIINPLFYKIIRFRKKDRLLEVEMRRSEFMTILEHVLDC